MEIRKNIQEGLGFFNDMDELLNVYKQKCQEYVSKRRAETITVSRPSPRTAVNPYQSYSTSPSSYPIAPPAQGK
jgi:hypothetical protein